MQSARCERRPGCGRGCGARRFRHVGESGRDSQRDGEQVVVERTAPLGAIDVIVLFRRQIMYFVFKSEILSGREDLTERTRFCHGRYLPVEVLRNDTYGRAYVPASPLGQTSIYTRPAENLNTALSKPRFSVMFMIARDMGPKT